MARICRAISIEQDTGKQAGAQSKGRPLQLLPAKRNHSHIARRMRYRLDPLPVPDLIEAIKQSGDFGPPQCRQAANDVFR
jgi:hypothetical protein